MCIRDSGIGALGAWATTGLGDGPLKGLLLEGLFGGLGTVLGLSLIHI